MGEIHEFSGASAKKKKRSRIVRALLIAGGTISLALGAVGIVMPLLPTTPFLLLSAACYCRSSDRLYNWLMGNKWFGEYIRNYAEGKGLTKKTKITALSVLWITIGFSIVFMLPRLLPLTMVLPMQLIMIAVAIGVSVHILRLPTFKKAQP